MNESALREKMQGEPLQVAAVVWKTGTLFEGISDAVLEGIDSLRAIAIERRFHA